MGDCLRAGKPLWFVTSQPGRVNSAFYPLWNGKMSTSQKAVMLCSWGVKADMVCLQVKLYVAISERFRKWHSF